MQLQVAQIVERTEAEGPGQRCAIWLQGCPLRCPGCCNPEMLPFSGGTAMSVDGLLARLVALSSLEGVTLLGGEPFAQAAAAAALCRGAQRLGLGVMIFSGFTLAELRADSAAQELLAACDLLVDGRYERTQPDDRRRWIGSRNQRMHFLTDRYHPDDPRMREPNTVEIRLSRGELTVNGWPLRAEALRRNA